MWCVDEGRSSKREERTKRNDLSIEPKGSKRKRSKGFEFIIRLKIHVKGRVKCPKEYIKVIKKSPKWCTCLKWKKKKKPNLRHPRELFWTSSQLLVNPTPFHFFQNYPLQTYIFVIYKLIDCRFICTYGLQIF